MKRNLYAILCVSALAVPAQAGSFNPAIEDAPVIAPKCTTLFGLPCHQRFDYEEPEGDNPKRPTLEDWWKEPPEQEPEPEPPSECSMLEWTPGSQYARGGTKPEKQCA